MIVAIDGPAASGKGTLARKLAAHLGLPHLDTGLLYRATARALMEQGSDLGDKEVAIAAARGLCHQRCQTNRGAVVVQGRDDLDAVVEHALALVLEGTLDNPVSRPGRSSR